MKILIALVFTTILLSLNIPARSEIAPYPLRKDCHLIAAKYRHVTLFNSDISIRGGLYALDDEEQGLFVTNLHVLRGSNVYLSPEKYAVFSVQIKGTPTSTPLWVDIAFIIDLTVYPKGMNDPQVRALFTSLSKTQAPTAAAVQHVCVTHITHNDPKMVTSHGIYDAFNTDSAITLFEEDSLIKHGSSGGIVNLIYTDVSGEKKFQPLGVLVCEQGTINRPGLPPKQRFKIISFDFLNQTDSYFLEQIQNFPEITPQNTCVPINGRNLGG